MLRKLGLVAVLCLVLAACTPKRELKGSVIVGLDDDGALVAVLGVCNQGWNVTLTVNAVTEPSTSAEVRNFVAEAELEKSTVGMRVVLRADQAPDGWSSQLWSLPDQGVVRVTVRARKDTGLAVIQSPDHADVDLAAVPPLPEDAEKESTQDC